MEPDAAQSPQRPDRGAEIGGCVRSLRQRRRPGLHLSVSPSDMAGPRGVRSRLAPRRLDNRQREHEQLSSPESNAGFIAPLVL